MACVPVGAIELGRTRATVAHQEAEADHLELVAPDSAAPTRRAARRRADALPAKLALRDPPISVDAPAVGRRARRGVFFFGGAERATARGDEHRSEREGGRGDEGDPEKLHPIMLTREPRRVSCERKTGSTFYQRIGAPRPSVPGGGEQHHADHDEHVGHVEDGPVGQADEVDHEAAREPVDHVPQRAREQKHVGRALDTRAW